MSNTVVARANDVLLSALEATAVSRAWGISDIIYSICVYIDVSSLISFELVNKSCQAVCKALYQELRTSRPYFYLSYKHHRWSDKMICQRINQSRYDGDSRSYNCNSSKILLQCGSFGSKSYKPYVFGERSIVNATKPNAKSVPPAWLNVKECSQKPNSVLHCLDSIGSAACTMMCSSEQQESALVIGGWNDRYRFASNNVYSVTLDRRTNEVIWTRETSIDGLGRCYNAAVTTRQGHVVHTGGGASPYRGAAVFDDTLLRRYEDPEKMWLHIGGAAAAGSGGRGGGCMNYKRCGHSSVTLFDDNVVVLGGYAGGEDYLNTVEILQVDDGGLSHGWTVAAPMEQKRSGAAVCVGPEGSVYVTGGSSDGINGLSSMERFDPREGKWSSAGLPHMCRGRGYTTGCMGSSGMFYVSGGLADREFVDGIECYDFRANRWRVVELSGKCQLGPLAKTTTGAVASLASDEEGGEEEEDEEEGEQGEDDDDDDNTSWGTLSADGDDEEGADEEGHHSPDAAAAAAGISNIGEVNTGDNMGVLALALGDLQTTTRADEPSREEIQWRFANRKALQRAGHQFLYFM